MPLSSRIGRLAVFAPRRAGAAGAGAARERIEHLDPTAEDYGAADRAPTRAG